MSGLFGDFVLVGSNTQNGNDVDDKTFDYVTVRGGTSGLVVANRLIEDRRTTVLVIERGSFDNTLDPPTPAVVSQWNIAWIPEAFGTGPLHLRVPSFQYPDIATFWNALRIQPAVAVPPGANTRTGPIASVGATTLLLLSLPQLLSPPSTARGSLSTHLLSQNPLQYLPEIYSSHPALLKGYKDQRTIWESRSKVFRSITSVQPRVYIPRGQSLSSRCRKFLRWSISCSSVKLR